MAKNMAKIENEKVINIEWHSDEMEETEECVNCGDVPVNIGDEYRDRMFYRNGEKVLSPMESMVHRLEDAESALKILLGGEV